MAEIDINGEDVFQWLLHAEQSQWNALVDCGLDDGVREDPLPIVAVRKDILEVRLDEPRGATATRAWAVLRQGCLVVPQVKRDLRDMIQQGLPTQVVALKNVRAWLREHGFQPDPFASDDDRLLVADILHRSETEGHLPPARERSMVYEAVMKAGQHKPAVSFFTRWLQLIEDQKYPEHDALGRLLLAVLLRHAKQPERSLDVSNVIDRAGPYLRASDHEMSMLCCHRAAAMLDLYEKTLDRALLPEARRYLNRGWAIRKGQELFLAYQRWHKLAGEKP